MSTLISELLRGEWLIHNPEAYLEIIEQIRNKADFDFVSKHKKEEKALAILDSFGNPLSSKDGNIDVKPNSIAQVRMQGEIFAYSDWCVAGADEIVAELYKAQELSNVDATIFRIDSPGGSTKAIDPFREFGKYKTKPVIGLIKEGYSLGYWAAIEACDYIILDGDISSRVGSIGVLASFKDNTKKLEAEGIVTHMIRPPESNHKNQDFEDAKKGEYAGIIKNSLSPLAQSFQNGVRAKRPNLIEEDGVLNGATYFGKDALRLGLIDEIGDIRTAIAKARELAMQSALNKSLL